MWGREASHSMSRGMALPLRVASSHSMPAPLITLCTCAEQAHPAQTCMTSICKHDST